MESVIREWRFNFTDFYHEKSFLTSFFFVAITVILYCIVKAKDLLPGPMGLPFLGQWPFLDSKTGHIKMMKWQEKYGDIYSFRYAGALYINLGSVKALRELHLNKADHFERFSGFSLFTFFFQDGVAFLNGEPWKMQRKFNLQMFKEFGMTTFKENMGTAVYDSIQETIDYMRTKKGEPFDILPLLADKCNAILRRTLLGDFGMTEQEVREYNNLYLTLMSFLTPINSLFAGNFSRYLILPFKSGYKESKKTYNKMLNILQEVVDRHKTTFDEDNPRDYIDAYFKERNERRAKQDITVSYFTDKMLVSNLFQFVGDGVISIAGFVSVFIKYVTEHQEEQEKIFSELSEVVGHDRDPTIEDKSKLLYSNAFVLEVLRVMDVFPFFPSQQCIKETTVRGFRIPKDAITLMNLHGCHFNPNIYKEPDKFNPSRFLTEEGKPRAELPITFGVGRRACLGESFTMVQVFLFLVTIIKNFKLTMPEKSQINDLDIILSEKLEVCAHPRY